MRIREYREADLAPLERMHAQQGFDYAFPDLRDPIFVSKMVLENNAAEVVMPSRARLTCEMYLLMNRDGKKSLQQGNRKKVTQDCRRCTKPLNRICSRAALITHTPGCRRRSLDALAADSHPWAGSATTHGRRTAFACEQIKNSSPP
jgi:hypothetical protein